MTRSDWLAWAGLLLLVLAGHGASLDDGYFFDDQWYRHTLGRYGWSFNELLESSTLELPGELAHLWWQEQDLHIRTARPLAMLLMKLQFLAVDGSAVGMHAFGLGWHALSAILLYQLAAWGLRSRGAGFAAAALFVVNPHSVIAVGWIAAQNALIGGALFLAALLAFVRGSFDPPAPPRRRPLSPWHAAAAGLWLASLFSRETAIVLPAVALAIDVGFGGVRAALRRWPVYVLFAVVGGAYLYWRLVVFPRHEAPPIYFTSAQDAAYGLFAAAKLLHLLFAQVFYTPMLIGLVPYGAGAVGVQHAASYAFMTLVVGGVAVWYVWSSRGQAGRWVWPIWTVLAFVPVIPVFTAPHFTYLPAAAYFPIVATILRRLRGRWGVVVGVFIVAATVWSHALYRHLYRSVVRAEQLITADIMDHTPRPSEGARVYFVNLPIVGVYSAATLRAEWGVDDLEGEILTFADHPMKMQSDFVIVQVDAHTFELLAPPPGYFAGFAGRMLLDASRPGRPLASGEVVRRDGFETTVVAADARGVTRLRLRFDRPLASPDLLFFASSHDRGAYRVRFDSPDGGVVAPDLQETIVWRARRDAWLGEREMLFAVLRFVQRIVRADLYLTGGDQP